MLVEQQVDLLKECDNIQTISNIPVKVDKAIYTLSGNTPIGVSGTLEINGIKLRGVWDSLGRPMELKKSLTTALSHPFLDIKECVREYDKELLTLVRVKQLE